MKFLKVIFKILAAIIAVGLVAAVVLSIIRKQGKKESPTAETPAE